MAYRLGQILYIFAWIAATIIFLLGLAVAPGAATLTHSLIVVMGFLVFGAIVVGLGHALRYLFSDY